MTSRRVTRQCSQRLETAEAVHAHKVRFTDGKTFFRETSVRQNYVQINHTSKASLVQPSSLYGTKFFYKYDLLKRSIIDTFDCGRILRPPRPSVTGHLSRSSVGSRRGRLRHLFCHAVGYFVWCRESPFRDRNSYRSGVRLACNVVVGHHTPFQVISAIHALRTVMFSH